MGTINAMVTAEAPYCLLINGMPGAGKSTVSRRVAERTARSARLDAAVVGSMIVNGGVWALGEPADEAARQVELGNRNLCALAGHFAAAGFTPVIDTVIPSRSQLDLFLELLAPRTVLHIVLAPGIETCRQRNATRDPDQRWDFTGYEALDREMIDGFGDRAWWIDTAAQTADQTAELIMAKAPERAEVR